MTRQTSSMGIENQSWLIHLPPMLYANSDCRIVGRRGISLVNARDDLKCGPRNFSCSDLAFGDRIDAVGTPKGTAYLFAADEFFEFAVELHAVADLREDV